ELGRVALRRVFPLHIIDDDKEMITGGGSFATNDENATIGKHRVERNTGVALALISVRPFGAIHSHGLKARHSAWLRRLNPKTDDRFVQTLCSDFQSEKQAKGSSINNSVNSFWTVIFSMRRNRIVPVAMERVAGEVGGSPLVRGNPEALVLFVF